jgi:predicted methyltransferase
VTLMGLRLAPAATLVTALLSIQGPAAFTPSTSFSANDAQPSLAAGQARVLDSAQEERDRWQRVPEILAAVGAGPGGHVADVGCGDGFLTSRLARAVGPSGRVYAVDIAEEALQRLRRRVEAEVLTNVEIISGRPDDPRLPAGTLDGAIIVNAYHEMPHHSVMIRHIRAALKPEGRLVVVEPISDATRGLPRDEQVRKHDLGPEHVEAELRAAGFRVSELRDPFATAPDGQQDYWLIVARSTGAPEEAITPQAAEREETGAPAPAPAAVEADAATPDQAALADPALRLSVEEAAMLRAAGAVVVLDVRGEEAWRAGHIPGSRPVVPGDVERVAVELAALGQPVITYCS